MENATIEQVRRELLHSQKYSHVLLGFQLDMMPKANEYLPPTDYMDDFSDEEFSDSEDEEYVSEYEEENSEEEEEQEMEIDGIHLVIDETQNFYYLMDDGEIGVIKGPGDYLIPTDIAQRMTDRLEDLMA